MTNVRIGASGNEVRQGARRRLFVEGKANSLDPAAISAVVGPSVDVVPLGPCFNVRAAAEALFPHHQDYYFLADRDYTSSDVVDELWLNFPNTVTHNFLVWRKHELENYFVDPSFAIKSSFLKAGKKSAEIERYLEKTFGDRLWVESVNRYIESVRASFRVSLKFFEDSEILAPTIEKCATMAISRMKAIKFSRPSDKQIKDGIRDAHQLLGGGRPRLQLGVGAWLDQMPAKEVFKGLISRFMAVTDRTGTRLNGVQAENEFVRDLLAAAGATGWPDDFVQLRRILT